MKILVTGAAGFIGSNFVFYMLDRHREHDIVALDALTYAGNLETLEPVMNNERFAFVKADIADRKTIFTLFEEEKFDTVVNFADGQAAEVRGRNTVLLYAVLFIAAMSVAGTLVFRQTGYMDDYGRTELAAGAAESVSDRIYKARYGDDTLRSMPEGDFSELGNLEFTGQTMLEIESDKYVSLYLRGFTGCDYNGSGWNETDGRTLYSNADDFYWLHDAGLFGQNQLSYAARNIDKKVSEDTLTMKIKNVGADRRYYYTPYELTSLVTEGKGNKSVSVMDDSVLDDGSFTASGYSGEHSYTVTSLKN